MPETLADRYRRMPDDGLLNLARDGGLDPLALDLLRAEITRRKLRPPVAADADLSEADVDRLAAAVRALPCLECNRTDAPLNAGDVSKTMSFMLFTTHDRETLVACPSCLGRRARSALVTSLVLGWWGIPWGPIRTVQSIAANVRTLRGRTSPEPTPALRQFVRDYPSVAASTVGRPAATRPPKPTRRRRA